MNFLKNLKTILSLKYIFHIPKKSKVAEFGIGFYYEIFDDLFKPSSSEQLKEIKDISNM